jgi:hypothetical protein
VRSVRSGQRLDDRRLAVIDMPCGRDDHRVKRDGEKKTIDFTAGSIFIRRAGDADADPSTT